MSFNINEIKSWAKSKGFTVKKSEEGYTWWGEGVKAEKSMSIDEVVTAIFNRITKDKFVEYQKKFKKKGGLV